MGRVNERNNFVPVKEGFGGIFRVGGVKRFMCSHVYRKEREEFMGRVGESLEPCMGVCK